LWRKEIMNSDDLEYFMRVAAHGSISRAPIELGTDPSTLSRLMARLETDSRTRLFHRSGRGVSLTDAGKALLEHARQVQAAVEDARRAVQSFSGKGPAQLVIAAQPTIARICFGALGKALHRRFPETRLRFAEGLGANMLDWLASGEIDLAVLYMPTHACGLKVDVLLRENVRLVLPAGYPGIGEAFPVSRLGEVPLILPSTPHGLRLLAASLAARAGATLNIALECDTSISVTSNSSSRGLSVLTWKPLFSCTATRTGAPIVRASAQVVRSL
jgi:DNA-binding transcriptional LysR family regulator